MSTRRPSSCNAKRVGSIHDRLYGGGGRREPRRGRCPPNAPHDAHVSTDVRNIAPKPLRVGLARLVPIGTSVWQSCECCWPFFCWPRFVGSPSSAHYGVVSYRQELLWIRPLRKWEPQGFNPISGMRLAPTHYTSPRHATDMRPAMPSGRRSGHSIDPTRTPPLGRDGCRRLGTHRPTRDLKPLAPCPPPRPPTPPPPPPKQPSHSCPNHRSMVHPPSRHSPPFPRCYHPPGPYRDTACISIAGETSFPALAPISSAQAERARPPSWRRAAPRHHCDARNGLSLRPQDAAARVDLRL